MPLVEVLMSQKPQLIEEGSRGQAAYMRIRRYFRAKNVCWEADRGHRADCLAYANNFNRRKLRWKTRYAPPAHMRGYAALVCVEIPGRTPAALGRLSDLIEISNRHMTRLFKVEHYYNRMTDMDLTISQMGTMMQSMTDPVILTDTHYRVVLQNKAAERYFKLPEDRSSNEISEGLVRAIELNNLLYTAALSSMAVSAATPIATSRWWM